MTIDKIFTKAKKLNVIVVGDSMLDSYKIGSVTRQSPVADVPIVDIKYMEFDKHAFIVTTPTIRRKFTSNSDSLKRCTSTAAKLGCVHANFESK